MKERLTERADGTIYCKDTYDTIIDRLAEYEDLEEQGLLVRLPCKVGDKLYLVYSPFGDIDEWEIIDIQIGNKTKMLFRLGHKGTDDYAAVLEKELGEYAFLTKTEAEKRLKQLQFEDRVKVGQSTIIEED